MILTNDQGEIFAANKSACRLLKKTEKEITKKGRAGVVDTTDSRLINILEEREKRGWFNHVFG
jgi:PAS domain-containing protein